MKGRWRWWPRLVLVLWLGAALAVHRYGERPLPPGRFDAIVIPGCAVRPHGEPSPALYRRTMAAVGLYRRGLAPKLICTGGVGTYPPSEAAVEYGIALAAGVPAQAMLREERSSSTEENARFAAELAGRGRVLVVTDAYHVWRCERVFRRHFGEARGVGIGEHWWTLVRGAVVEVGKIAYYAARGRL